MNIIIEELKKIECRKCGKCCINYPCNLIPEDLKTIAKYLDITIDELIKKYLVLDFWIGERSDKYYFISKRKGDQEGVHIVSWGWAFDKRPCIFLTENNKCSIHDVKPFGGRNLECWNEDKCRTDRLYYAEKWKGNRRLKKYMEKCLND